MSTMEQRYRNKIIIIIIIRKEMKMITTVGKTWPARDYYLLNNSQFVSV